MINELKIIIQSNLGNIQGLKSGIARPDDILESKELYYGYEITYRSNTNSVDYSTTDYDITITGRLVGKDVSVAVMDEYSEKIAKVLKDLRFDYTIQDTTSYDNVKKKTINGSASMNDATYFIR